MLFGPARPRHEDAVAAGLAIAPGARDAFPRRRARAARGRAGTTSVRALTKRSTPARCGGSFAALDLGAQQIRRRGPSSRLIADGAGVDERARSSRRRARVARVAAFGVDRERHREHARDLARRRRRARAAASASPSGYPRAQATPELVVAIAAAPHDSMSRALPASHAFGSTSNCPGGVQPAKGRCVLAVVMPMPSSACRPVAFVRRAASACARGRRRSR